MGFNPKFKPFQDKRVRQAINYAIDADLIIKRLVKNKAYLANGWLPASSPAYDPALKGYASDPAKAKQLLKEAGYENGFTVEVTTTNNEGYGQPILEAVIPFLAKVGITVKPKIVENAVFQELVFNKSDYEAYLYSVGSGPDPLAALKCFHSATPHSACNYVGLRPADRGGGVGTRRTHPRRGAEARQRLPDRRGAGLVLRLRQGRARLSALDPWRTAECGRAHGATARRDLDRRRLTTRRHEMMGDSHSHLHSRLAPPMVGARDALGACPTRRCRCAGRPVRRDAGRPNDMGKNSSNLHGSAR